MNLKYACQKRDHACIWFAHLPLELARHFEVLAPDSPVQLLINGSQTVWKRMKPGGGRATPGVRIESGKDVWNIIELGSGFTLEAGPSFVLGESVEASAIALSPAIDSPNARTLTNPSVAMFGAYLFIDYSGAEKVNHQRKAIRIAYGEGSTLASIVEERHDRATLVDFIGDCLRSASRRGVRVCLGQDHTFGIPIGLARELGISQLSWRSALGAFLDGKYDPDAPAFRDLRQFVCAMNRWLMAHGRRPYFWSATKAESYQVPGRDPRRGETDKCSYRLTDRCKSQFGRGDPKPFNRIGDPGTVGGQSILGMLRIRELIERCEQERIQLRFWPFDGLDIFDPEYERAHVAVEPYPSALRPKGVKQTDANDALYTALAVQEADLKGQAGRLFDLSRLRPSDVSVVRLEGWIVGHLVGSH
jgi:hypothetical protein